MNLDHYNRSFESIIDVCEEDADNRLRSMRLKWIGIFLDRLNSREKEWEEIYQELLRKSQDIGEIEQLNKPKPAKSVNFSQPLNNIVVLDLSKENKKPDATSRETEPHQPERKQEPQRVSESIATPKKKDDEFNDTHFSNYLLIENFARIQRFLEKTRNSLADLNTNPALKPFKNDLNLFIRTQVNSISNSDSQHLNNKVSSLSDLFNGKSVSFQGRLVDASKHPQGQLLAMDLAAQTFVTVGTRLVNSVPAIAKSMASVINGITSRNLSVFKDLIIGHLQERCPYLIPMNPKVDDFEQLAMFKIACGYSYDTKTQALEAEDRYLTRMRSMVLIHACVLADGYIDQSWSWLVAFMSLKPQPVITATILQAFLQESSKKLSSTYGRQYVKLLAFIRNDYASMIEEVTPKTSDRQSFIKLKNLLAEGHSLTSAPTMGSIFGAVRFG